MGCNEKTETNVSQPYEPGVGTAPDACWPAGVPRSIEPLDESLWNVFAARATDRPEEIGLHFLGRDYRWRELVDEAERLADGLLHLGVRPGDRVLLFMQNCPQYVTAFHAVLRVRAVVVPVNPMNKAGELEHYIADTQAHVAFASSDVAGELIAASSGLAEGLEHLITFDLCDGLGEAPPAQEWPEAWRTWLLARRVVAAPGQGSLSVHPWEDLAAQPALRQPLTAAGTDLAMLPYTSGTTGSPRGCMHSHASLAHNTLAAGLWLDMREGDATLIVAAMFHVTGLVMGMLASIRNGCRMVILPRWDRTVAARTIARQRVTHWPNIPTMVMDLLADDKLAREDLFSLRYIGGGGAQMPDAVGERLTEISGLHYVEGYGLTETAAPTHINPMAAPRRHCLGIPHIGTRAHVIDPVTLEPVPVGEVGEIVVNGPQLFQGYWRQPEATRDAFVDINGLPFFRTGDLGRVEADGFYTMADRLKRMINASGFKVWPAEVEAFLHRHPAVQECCVIAMRDPYRGESVKALVVLREGLAQPPSEDELIAWARERMAAYKYPRSIEFVAELPRTASGKVLWREAQASQDALEK